MIFILSLVLIAGPGEELKIDDEVFITHLKLLLDDLPSYFPQWHLILECLDISLLQRREERSHVIHSFLKQLFLLSLHLSAGDGQAANTAASALAMAHAIALRYPRVRAALQILRVLSNKDNSNNNNSNRSNGGIRTFAEDDEVGDLAMKVTN